MKAEIKIVSLAVAGILGIGANLALAVPVANQQGDFWAKSHNLPEQEKF